MLDDNVAQEANRQADRAEVTVEVGLEFESFQGFLSEYSSNISTGGMFVKAMNPPPVGTVVRFTLKLKGDFQLFKGTGEVVWARIRSQGPRLPAGIGIRFLSIPDSAVDLIQKMVERYRDQGGHPFDVREADQGPMAGEIHQETSPGKSPERGHEPGPQDDLEDQTGSFTPDIFIPPDVLSKPSAPLAAAAPAIAPEASRRAPPAPRQVRLSLVVFLLLAAGVLGAFGFAFGERLVGWATGYDSSLEQPQVIDVPPLVSLNSQQVATTDQISESEPSAGASPSDAELQASISVDEPGLALNRIRLITWKEAPGGSGTLVTFWGDGHLEEQNLVQVRFGEGPTRELLKLKGVNWPFRDPILEVGSPEVRSIRTGFHPKSTLNELHVVIDLADPEVRLVSLERGPRNVELLFRH